MVKLVQLMSKDVADIADLLNPEIVPGAEFDALFEENMPAAVGEAEIEENVPECYFYETPEKQTNKLSKEWEFIEEYVEAFKALNDCTVAVQQLQLTLSDFYIEWIRAYVRISELDDSNRFKFYLISAMDRRQQKLFCNRIFRAALYLDP